MGAWYLRDSQVQRGLLRMNGYNIRDLSVQYPGRAALTGAGALKRQQRVEKKGRRKYG